MEDFLHTADKHYLRINLCSFFSTLPNNECQLWHNWLGHPNSKKLLFLLNFGVLLNKSHLSYKIFLLVSLVVTGEGAKLFLFHMLAFQLLVMVSFIPMFGVLHLLFHILTIYILSFLLMIITNLQIFLVCKI